MNCKVLSVAALGALATVSSAFGVVTVMPIGDSITVGVGDAEMGGYRQVVKANLGSQINFLGRKGDGAFVDNENEGWGGFTIKNLRDETITTIPQHTGFGQVILLTAGSNEFIWTPNPTIDGAQARVNAALADMHSLLWNTVSAAPNSTVFVSTIPAIRDWFHPENTYQYPEVEMYNAALPALVDEFSDLGYKTRFVDTMSSLHLQNDFADGVHPNDAGYAKIGQAWTNALNTVLPEPGSVLAMMSPLALLAMRRSRTGSGAGRRAD